VEPSDEGVGTALADKLSFKDASKIAPQDAVAGATEDESSLYHILLVAVLAAFSTYPLFQPYFFASSDGLFHLYRLMEYDVILRQGVLYPRWAYDFYLGLGMPLFNFYAPLTYYLAEIPRLLGLGYIDSLKVFSALLMMASGLGAYLYARTLLSSASSLLVAVMYMYVPYHIVNLYYRGDLAEYASYVWYPLILWSVYRLVESERLIYLFWGSLCLGALILTHNLSAFVFCGFLLLYTAAALARKHDWHHLRRRALLADLLRLAALAVLAAALTAFFWGPALMEKPLLTFDRLLSLFDYRQQFPTLEQLLPSWLIHRYGVIFRGSEVYGYKLGMLQVVFLALGPALLVLARRRLRPGLGMEMAVSLLVSALCLFLMLPASQWVWERVPLLDMMQFPWRFLAWMALPSALMAGSVQEALWARLRALALVLLVPLIVVSSVANARPILSDVKEADISPLGSMSFEMTTGAIGTAAAAEYLPGWAKSLLNSTPIALERMLGEGTVPLSPWLSPGMQVQQTERSPYRSTYRVQAAQAGDLVLGTVYFPGWQVFVDGQPVKVGYHDPYGLVKIALPAGEHQVELRFVETRLRTAFDLVSAAALLALLGLGVYQLRRGLCSTFRFSLFERRAMGSDTPLLDVTKGRDLVSPSDPSRAAGRGLTRGLQFHGGQLRTQSYGEGSAHGEGSTDVQARTEERRLGRFVGWAGLTPGRAAQLGLVIALVLAWLVGKSLFDTSYARADVSASPLLIEMDKGVRVEGYRLEGAIAAANGTTQLPIGRPVQVTVYWRVPADLRESFRPSLRLTNGYNHTWAYAESAEAFPNTATKAGALMATALSLEVQPYTPPGPYQLEVSFRSTSNARLLDTRRSLIVPLLPGDKVARIGPLFVSKSEQRGASLSQAWPDSILSQPVSFEDSLRLLALRLADGEEMRSGGPGAPLPVGQEPGTWQVAAGDTIHLDLLWQMERPTGVDYRVTARLVGEEGSLWAVRDSAPADGTYPTSMWDPGEIVRDQLNLAIPPETPPGHYDLALEVVAYSRSLSIMDRNHAPTGPTLHIGAIEVTPTRHPANPNGIGVQQRVDQAWPGGLRLYGYSLGSQSLRPGADLTVEMIWGADQAVTHDYRLRLSFADGAGKTWGAVVSQLAGDDYPTSQWRKGEVLRGRYHLPLVAAAPPSNLSVVAELLLEDGERPLAQLKLGEVQVRARERVYSATPHYQASAELGGQVKLLGFELLPDKATPEIGGLAAPAGSRITVVPYWQAIVGKITTSYTVSIQVLNSQGRMVAQHDSPPSNGEAPTTGWLPGEVITDEHQIDLPLSLPPGEYTLIAIMYDPANGQRLMATDGRDFAVLGNLQVTTGGR